MQNENTEKETVELHEGVFEEMADANVRANGEHAGFFHSLGRALSGEKVDNKFLKTLN